MNKPVATYLIDNEGGVEISVNGAKGKACLDLTAKIEEQLGTVTERTETAEMKESEAVNASKNLLHQ